MVRDIKAELRVALENHDFTDIGLTKLELAPGEKARGIYLGCVEMPPAASRQDLGRWVAAVYWLDDNTLKFDPLRTTTRFVPSIEKLAPVEIEDHGKNGRTRDIRVRPARAFDAALSEAILAEFRVPYTGDPSSFFEPGEWDGKDITKRPPEEYKGALSVAAATDNVAASEAFVDAVLARQAEQRAASARDANRDASPAIEPQTAT